MWQHRSHTVSKRERERRQRERERKRDSEDRDSDYREDRDRDYRDRDRQRQRERERRERGERERERDGVAGHVQDGSPDFGVYQVYARAVSPLLEKDAPETVSPLLEKDATGTPEVPVPVLHREGWFGPPPTEDVDDAHLARRNSRTLHSARIVHSFTVSCSLTALAALADRSFFTATAGCYHEVDRVSDALAEARAKAQTNQGSVRLDARGVEGSIASLALFRPLLRRSLQCDSDKVMRWQMVQPNLWLHRPTKTKSWPRPFGSTQLKLCYRTTHFWAFDSGISLKWANEAFAGHE